MEGIIIGDNTGGISLNGSSKDLNPFLKFLTFSFKSINFSLILGWSLKWTFLFE